MSDWIDWWLCEVLIWPLNFKNRTNPAVKVLRIGLQFPWFALLAIPTLVVGIAWCLREIYRGEDAS